MTTPIAPDLELIDIAKNAPMDSLQDSNHEPNEEVAKRTFVGGSVGYIDPTLRNAHAVGGSAGWVHHW